MPCKSLDAGHDNTHPLSSSLVASSTPYAESASGFTTSAVAAARCALIAGELRSRGFLRASTLRRSLIAALPLITARAICCGVGVSPAQAFVGLPVTLTIC